MNIFEGSGGIPNIIYFLASMADLEIQKTDDPRILFRSSSLTAKCLTNFMKRCGTSYLIKTLKKPILDVLNQKESCEVSFFFLKKRLKIKIIPKRWIHLKLRKKISQPMQKDC